MEILEIVSKIIDLKVVVIIRMEDPTKLIKVAVQLMMEEYKLLK